MLINLQAFDVIEDTAALIGGTLLNLAARAVSSQSTLPPSERRSVTMAVDEFHTIPGADYEQVFGELAKYGANMVLATQTLARLDRLTEADRTRDLRAAVFSNLDGLFAFHTSAEDAEYLAEELGGGLNKQDLLELGHYQCYVRITDVRNGERLPAFSVRLDAPPAGDAAIAAQLARESALRFGGRCSRSSSTFKAPRSAYTARKAAPTRARGTRRGINQARAAPAACQRRAPHSAPTFRGASGGPARQRVAAGANSRGGTTRQVARKLQDRGRNLRRDPGHDHLGRPPASAAGAIGCSSGPWSARALPDVASRRIRVHGWAGVKERGVPAAGAAAIERPCRSAQC